jgi:dienelactone hydrolase/lysophospholipase L1-like esterase
MLTLLLLLPVAPPPNGPTVVLVGDSIRLGYAPQVARELGDAVRLVNPKGAGDSAWLRANLETLVLDAKPDLVHLNVGLHDLRKDRKTGKYQVPLSEYESNLNDILTRLKETKATLLFALTTPVDDERGKKRGGAFDRFEADVVAYNTVARKVAARHGIVVHDLHTISGTHQVADGTHFTPAGIALQARAVSDCVRRHLAIRAAKPSSLPVADEKATAAYKAAEAKRDADVPAGFKDFPVPEFVTPKDAAEWKKRRPEVMRLVTATLGKLPARPKPSATLVSREIHPGFVVESLRIPNGDTGEMSALWLAPPTSTDAPKEAKNRPAILWLHSSSYDATQLLMRGYNGGDEPLGETFTKAGYVVLAPDACWYGVRAGRGPSGSAETTRAQHDALFKYHLWRGRTLWGMFVRDDQIALDYLATRSEADMTRVGATGISMGSTRAWWLAALDERVKCVVGVACLTRYQNLIAHGELRQHGVYYFVIGLLEHFDIEGVLALMAPRPFLALNGELDAGSPADGIREIEKRLGAVYAALGAKDAFRSVRYAHTGHVYTPAMRKEMLAWFAKWLK